MSGIEKTRVSVNIYGAQYKLMGNAETPATYLQLVASQVDEQMRKIAKGYPHLDMPRIAVLTAVNFADEMSRLKDAQVLSHHEDSKLKIEKDHELDKQRAECERLKKENLLLREQFGGHQKQQDNIKNELVMLRDENNELQKRLQLESNSQLLTNEMDKDIHAKYEQLKEEYRKLQSEYNEWIQLVDRDEPGS